MARFPSIDSEGAFEAPEVQNSIKELVTGSTDGITVDTSVGTRVFVGNTMIHGNTGWRNVSDLFNDAMEYGRIEIARHDQYTSIHFDSVQLITGNGDLSLGELPAGFRPLNNRESRVGGTYNNNPYLFHMFRIFNNTLYWAGGYDANTRQLINDRVTGAIRGTLSFPSNNWPTSLPGTPA